MSTPAASRVLLLILDGLGDLPHPALAGRTPLEAAHTPNLDRAATQGRTGLVDPLRPGLAVGTQTGTAVLLGLPPGEVAQLPRGPVEAAGVGVALQPGDVALRCNFVTLKPGPGNPRVLDRRAGRIRTGTQQLADAVNDLGAAGGIEAHLAPAAQHRAVLRLSGPGLSSRISDTDPRDAGPSVVLPTSHALESGDTGAVRTATALNELLQRIFVTLEAHPVNRERRALGQAPANGLITRGAGGPVHVHSLLQELDVTGAVVAGDRTVQGLAALCGLTRITRPEFTCLPDTDLAAKAAAAREALDTHDFVCLHVKATDILAHDRDPEGKRDFLERLDQALAGLLAEDVVLGVTADHTTSSLTGNHTGDPVPALIRAPGGPRDGTTQFGEATCASGGLGRVLGRDFFRTLLGTAGYAPTVGPVSGR